MGCEQAQFIIRDILRKIWQQWSHCLQVLNIEIIHQEVQICIDPPLHDMNFTSQVTQVLSGT